MEGGDQGNFRHLDPGPHTAAPVGGSPTAAPIAHLGPLESAAPAPSEPPSPQPTSRSPPRTCAPGAPGPRAGLRALGARFPPARFRAATPPLRPRPSGQPAGPALPACLLPPGRPRCSRCPVVPVNLQSRASKPPFQGDYWRPRSAMGRAALASSATPGRGHGRAHPSPARSGTPTKVTPSPPHSAIP